MIMSEIGGYFGLEPLVGNEYHKGLIALNTARNALLYILKVRKIRKLFIPYFLCDSVSRLCKREGFSYEYYEVDYEFLPRLAKRLNKDEYIYVVNYYGQLDNDRLLNIAEEYHGNIIVDNVQAFFQRPIDGIDTIYSCRKFFGVSDGAYLSTSCSLNEDLKTDASSKRMKHLLGRFETNTASVFYSDFKSNEESFDELELMNMSKLTHNLLGAIDYKKIRIARERNFGVLHEFLSNHNRLHINIPMAPYAYPFYCENGIAVRKMLSKKNIYIPTLWPNVFCLKDEIAKDYSKNILPLPCDQRYTSTDMQYVVSEVLQCIS